MLEHVFEPQEFLSEVKRVLKPGGNFLITVPFIWDEHEVPNDFGRYSSYGLKYILRKNNFEIIKFEKSTVGIECIFQLLICQIEKKIFTNSTLLNYLIKLLIISPINILAKILNFIPSKNTDMYLDNILLAKKI